MVLGTLSRPTVRAVGRLPVWRGFMGHGAAVSLRARHVASGPKRSEPVSSKSVRSATYASPPLTLSQHEQFPSHALTNHSTQEAAAAE